VTRPNVRYAGFWRRFAAFMLDYILFSSLLFLVLYLIHGADYLHWAMYGEDQGAVYSLAEALLNYVLLPAVIVAFWIKMSATPGKLLLSCKVADADTLRPLRPGQAALRCFGYLISLIPLGFGFIYAAWDPRKQALHDKIARTVVIVEDEADRLLQEWREQRQ
jgi:uncharacterized RDD family membrane protein YckC